MLLMLSLNPSSDIDLICIHKRILNLRKVAIEVLRSYAIGQPLCIPLETPKEFDDIEMERVRIYLKIEDQESVDLLESIPKKQRGFFVKNLLRYSFAVCPISIYSHIQFDIKQRTIKENDDDITNPTEEIISESVENEFDETSILLTEEGEIKETEKENPEPEKITFETDEIEDAFDSMILDF